MANTTRSVSGPSIRGQSKEINIADLPQSYRDKLCKLLDEMNIWMELANLMQLSTNDINAIQRRETLGGSPTDQLLRIWGNVYNHTVTELFMLLFQKKLYSAMRMLKSFVSYKYHILISNSHPDLSQLLALNARNQSNHSEKVLNCSTMPPTSLQTTDNNCTTMSTSKSTSSSFSSIGRTINERSVRQYADSNLEINYEELSAATNKFHHSHILGKGGFGTVYKGYWKHTEVAIKQIHYCSPNGCENIKVQIQQSLNELKYLNSFRHDNVLPLYGYSIRGEKPCLVYQYMRGGSLETRLYSNEEKTLTLSERIKISLGVARGINYIHTHTPDKPLIHGDIKPANVLLDECLTPKIGDFGLAREGPNAIKMAVEVTQVFGTKWYLPPEFLNLKKLSTQVDTYSFGVTLFETFMGQRVFDSKRQPTSLTEYVAAMWNKSKKDMADLIDPKLELKCEEQCERCEICANVNKCYKILSLGRECTAENPHERPEMEDVLLKLSQYC